MTLHHLLRRSAAFVLIASLAACGGGGGGSGGGSSFANYPSSGAYGWVLKANGNTSSLAYGLSLVHPSAPDTEFVVEPAGQNVTDSQLVSSGALDAANKRFNSLLPVSLVYIRGGDLRSVPMQANGLSPASQIIRASTLSACRFAVSAIDYASPSNSRFLVTTANTTTGSCTTNTGLSELRTQTGVALELTVLDSNAEPFDVVRDPTTLAPRGWIYARTVGLWTGTSFNIRNVGQPSLTYVVASTYNQTLASDGSKLIVFTFTGGNNYTTVELDAGITSGNNWKLIGFDRNNFYVSSSSTTSFSDPWTVLKISRASPTATVLAPPGTGQILVSSMGTDVLYLTVANASNNQLVYLAKAGGPPTVEDLPAAAFAAVQTSSDGKHLVSTANNLDSSGAFTPSTVLSVRIIDEANNLLYGTSTNGGFPLTVAEAASVSLDNSESRSRFVFATGFSPNLSANGASLVSYDTASGTARTLGTLPGFADFGSDQGFIQPIAGPTSLGGAFSARVAGGAIQSNGSKVYSFDVLTENSLRAKTVVVN